MQFKQQKPSEKRAPTANPQPAIKIRKRSLNLPLYQAIFTGDTCSIQQLLEQGGDPNCLKTPNGESLLHIACHRCTPEIVRILLQNNASVHARAHDKKTPLHVACYHAVTAVTQLLMEYGADPNAKDYSGNTPIHLVLQSKFSHLDKLKLLLDKGGKVLSTDNHGTTPLHTACELGKFRAAELLINHRPDVTARNSMGATPLLLVAQSRCRGDTRIAQLLIKHGAQDVNVVDHTGRTPLHWACINRRLQLSQLLMKQGADPKARDHSLCVPLHYLPCPRTRGELRFSKNLLQRSSACLNAKDIKGQTPLHKACSDGRHETALFLVNNGAEAATTDKHGQTPLHKFHRRNPLSLYNLLVSRGIHIDSTDHLGNTALHQTCAQASYKSTTLLLSLGANPNIQNKNGQTALHLACLTRSTTSKAITATLLNSGCNPNFQDSNSDTAFHVAISTAKRNQSPLSSELVKLLVSHGTKPDILNLAGSTPLHLCLRQPPRLDLIQVLLDCGVDPNLKDKQGRTLLHLLPDPDFNCNYPIRPVAYMLFDHQGNPNAKDQQGNTPLHSACYHGHPDLIDALVNEGSDLEARNNLGDTPLHTAASTRGNIELVELVLEKGANAKIRGHKGRLPLHIACINNNTSLIKLLLIKSYPNTDPILSSKDHSGDTPLHAACEAGHLEATQLLVEGGSNVSSRRADGTTTLHTACRMSHEPLIRLLLASDPSLANVCTPDGWSPLHEACKCGHVLAVQILLDFGADPDATSYQGVTPLQVASTFKHHELVWMICSRYPWIITHSTL